MQKGNAPLMALVGGGTLGTRMQLLGEWSDLASLFNACDVVCSSALNDGSRMTLVTAMLCGVPCVATGIGAQGEVIGHHGVAIEAGSPPAFVKGIQRVLQLTPEKRAAMAQGARKHALQNYVYVRSLQRYLQLYYDLIGRQSLVSQEMPTPEIDASVPVPAKVGATADTKKPLVTLAELADPDSLETKVAEHEALPKWRVDQEQQRQKREQEVSEKIASTQSEWRRAAGLRSRAGEAAEQRPSVERTCARRCGRVGRTALDGSDRCAETGRCSPCASARTGACRCTNAGGCTDTRLHRRP